MYSAVREKSLKSVETGFRGELLFPSGTGSMAITMEDLLNRVVNADALQILDTMPAESVDMVFLDPPYFLQLPGKDLRRWRTNDVVEAVYDEWDSFDSFEKYDRLIYQILQKIKRVMKPSATLWAISTYHSIFRIGKIMQDLGYWILNDVIWVKTNPMPNWLGVRFTNATETLIWAVRDHKAKGYTFNREYAKSLNNGRLAINVWSTSICSGKERLRFDNGAKVHSTQKPERLLEYVILSSTKEEDVILDPMAGTGTTGFVAGRFNRNYVMIEKNRTYVDQIIKRMH